MVIVNYHGNSTGSGYKEVHGDYGYDILRVRWSWNMHWLMTCRMCLKKRNSHLISHRSDYTACVISKKPVQACDRCDGYRSRGICSAASAGKRHVDWYAAPNKAPIYPPPCLFKREEVVRAQLTRSKISSSGITSERVMLRTEATI